MYTWKGLAKGIYVWTRCDPAENIKKLCQSITTARTGDSPSSASDTSDCAQKEQHIRQSCILWIYIMAVWKARKLLNRAGWLSSAEPTSTASLLPSPLNGSSNVVCPRLAAPRQNNTLIKCTVTTPLIYSCSSHRASGKGKTMRKTMAEEGDGRERGRPRQHCGSGNSEE